MKKYFLIAAMLFLASHHHYPKTGTDSNYDSTKHEHVSGYTKHNGTYVESYNRHSAGTAKSNMNPFDAARY